MENQPENAGNGEIAASQSEGNAAQPACPTSSEVTAAPADLQLQTPGADGGQGVPPVTPTPDGAGGKAPEQTTDEKVAAIQAAIRGRSGDEKPPMTKEELEKEFDQLVKMTGDCYLQIEFHKKNLEQFVMRSLYLQREGMRRAELDEKLAAEKIEKAKAKRDRKSAAAAGADVTPETAAQLARIEAEIDAAKNSDVS